jgi:pectinesterase
MNTGEGARANNRVRWLGFHVITNANDASVFTVERFIDGKSWIPETGIPFWTGL